MWLKSLDKERLKSELSHIANTKKPPWRKPQAKRLSIDRLYHYCNLSYISWKLPDNVSVLENVKCPGPVLCQKENSQTRTQVSPGDSLCLTDISERLALNSVNPDFTPCRLVLDRKVTGRAQSKQSVAYPNQWEFLRSGVLAIFDTFYCKCRCHFYNLPGCTRNMQPVIRVGCYSSVVFILYWRGAIGVPILNIVTCFHRHPVFHVYFSFLCRIGKGRRCWPYWFFFPEKK